MKHPSKNVDFLLVWETHKHIKKASFAASILQNACINFFYVFWYRKHNYIEKYHFSPKHLFKCVYQFILFLGAGSVQKNVL